VTNRKRTPEYCIIRTLRKIAPQLTRPQDRLAFNGLGSRPLRAQMALRAGRRRCAGARIPGELVQTVL
jgi:hypothetical protein